VRLQLPLQISLTKTLIFAVSLFCVQQFEHTSLAFSLLFFGFVVMGNLAFNAGGGFSRASGAYVFLFVMLVCLIGVTWKAVLGEPADSNLRSPVLTMGCYTASMLMLLLVILANKKITGNAQGLAPGGLDYTLSALGCVILGIVLVVLNSTVGAEPGSLLSILNQLTQFFPLAIILGTIGAVRDSNGRRSVNFISGAAMVIVMGGSMLEFTKQGMFTPIVCWLLSVCFAHFRLRWIHYLVIAAFTVFGFTIVPLIAEGRDSAPDGANYAQRAAIVYHILTHLAEAKQQENETNDNIRAAQIMTGYYDSTQGFIERLSIIPIDDAFFNYTAKGNYIGYNAILLYYENFIPHFILPDKPQPYNGNYYAHEIGGFLAPDDFSTGVSFSPVAEAFHVDGWTGIFLLLPAIWLSLFVSVDYICGDLRNSPWGLLVVVLFAHAAAESLLGSLIYISVYGNLGIVLAILFCTRFTPVLGQLFYGNQRKQPEPVPALRPAVR